MAKRKKTKIPLSLIKVLFVGLLALALGLFICKSLYTFLKTSDYFAIKHIVIDPTLEIVDRNALLKFKGQNIFTVDLEDIQRKIAYKYPQVEDLRVIREYPDQLSLTAMKRYPFAQTIIGDKILTVDEGGVVLSTTSKKDKELPFIDGLKISQKRFLLGSTLSGRELRLSLRIIQSFQTHKDLGAYTVVGVNVDNLSKIQLVIQDDLMIIIDRDHVDKKMNILGLILAKGRIDLKSVEYIDLRPKDPAIRYK